VLLSNCMASITSFRLTSDFWDDLQPRILASILGGCERSVEEEEEDIGYDIRR